MVHRSATITLVVTLMSSYLCVDAFAPVSSSFTKSVETKSISSSSSSSPHRDHCVSPRLKFTGHKAVSLPSINLGVDTSALSQYFLETLISSGVPAFFWIAVIAFAAKSFKNAKESSSNQGPNGGLFGKTAVTELYDDLYGTSNDSTPKPFLPFGRPNSKSTPKNLGIPTDEFLKVIKINDRYLSYDYSLTAATQSKAKAAARYRSQSFDSAIQRSFDSTIIELNPAQKLDLLTEEKAFLQQGSEMLSNINELQRKLTEVIIREEMNSMDVEIGEVDAYGRDGKEIIDATIVEKDGVEASKKDEKKKKGKKKDSKSKKLVNKFVKEIEKENTELLKLEMEFIRAVIEIMGPDRANAIRAALLGNIAGGAAGVAGGLLKSLQNRPLSAVLSAIGYSNEDGASRNVFVTDFPGDVTASQVENLREEVTAIIRAAKPGDEALVKLQTGGGTVTGYGLAAAQLQRFKQHGMKLTICVEQVAASGGYMMTCVADKVVASPFAVLGSIGVISESPNVYERLKKEGIEFQTITAGKYKRTLTPTKKVTDEDVQKSKEELEQVLTLFKSFVKENRPSLDIDSVATGETWFGEDALKRGLCDELRTVDDVLCEYVNKGYNVYEVSYDPTSSGSPLGGLLPIGATERKASNSNQVVRRMVKWLARNVISAVEEEISAEFQSKSSNNVKERFMARDPKDSVNSINF